MHDKAAAYIAAKETPGQRFRYTDEEGVEHLVVYHLSSPIVRLRDDEWLDMPTTDSGNPYFYDAPAGCPGRRIRDAA